MVFGGNDVPERSIGRKAESFVPSFYGTIGSWDEG